MNTVMSYLHLLLAATAVAQGMARSLGGSLHPISENLYGLTQATTHVSRGGLSMCVSGFVQIDASTSNNVKFDYGIPTNQSEVTQMFVSMFSPGVNFRESITAGVQNVSGAYNMGATLCMPANGTADRVQILTHGIGFDRYYWDFAPGYSYVDIAVAAGYATFFYDRLGIGLSTKTDPLNTIQSPLELEILYGLSAKIRGGELGNGNATTLIGVGHSFGSALTQGLTAAYPAILDAVVLTGYSTNVSGMAGFSLGQNAAIASENQPYRFSSLPAGYLVLDTAVSVQNTFFHAPGFDPTILALAAATKATTTVGEYLTTGNIVKPATSFRGPIAFVDGNEDLGFCFGNCSYPTNLLAKAISDLYPNSTPNQTMTNAVPDTGHGLNLHYAAADAFTKLQTFLASHGV